MGKIRPINLTHLGILDVIDKTFRCYVYVDLGFPNKPLVSHDISTDLQGRCLTPAGGTVGRMNPVCFPCNNYWMLSILTSQLSHLPHLLCPLSPAALPSRGHRGSPVQQSTSLTRTLCHSVLHSLSPVSPAQQVHLVCSVSGDHSQHYEFYFTRVRSLACC